MLAKLQRAHGDSRVRSGGSPDIAELNCVQPGDGNHASSLGDAQASRQRNNP